MSEGKPQLFHLHIVFSTPALQCEGVELCTKLAEIIAGVSQSLSGYGRLPEYGIVRDGDGAHCGQWTVRREAPIVTPTVNKLF